MSADGGHLGWRAGSSDTILKGDHSRTIQPKFGPDWPSSFREEDFLIFLLKFSILSHGRHLGWWAGSSDITFKGDHPGPFHKSLVLIGQVVSTLPRLLQCLPVAMHVNWELASQAELKGIWE